MSTRTCWKLLAGWSRAAAPRPVLLQLDGPPREATGIGPTGSWDIRFSSLNQPQAWQRSRGVRGNLRGASFRSAGCVWVGGGGKLGGYDPPASLTPGMVQLLGGGSTLDTAPCEGGTRSLSLSLPHLCLCRRAPVVGPPQRADPRVGLEVPGVLRSLLSRGGGRCPHRGRHTSASRPDPTAWSAKGPRWSPAGLGSFGPWNQ